MSQTEIIDAQIHTWEARTSRVWDTSFSAMPLTPAFPTSSAIAAMDALGIGAAILDVMPAYRELRSDGIYRYDNSYAEESIASFPGRFAATVRYDHRDPAVDELIAATRKQPGVLGLRITLRTEQQLAALDGGEYDAFLKSATRHNVPTMIFVPGALDHLQRMIARFPELPVTVDHLGLPQPPRKLDNPPFARLAKLLQLARFPNVSVKLCGAPAFSSEPYPYADLWPYLEKIIEAFGPGRIMWASDVTRLRQQFTYLELLTFLSHTNRISDTDKSLMLGGTVRRLLRWPKPLDASAPLQSIS